MTGIVQGHIAALLMKEDTNIPFFQSTEESQENYIVNYFRYKHHLRTLVLIFYKAVLQYIDEIKALDMFSVRRKNQII